MEVTHDKKFNLVYIKLTDRNVSMSKRVTDDVVLDFDDEGKIRGIELLDTAHISDIDRYDFRDITHERYTDVTPHPKK